MRGGNEIHWVGRVITESNIMNGGVDEVSVWHGGRLSRRLIEEETYRHQQKLLQDSFEDKLATFVHLQDGHELLIQRVISSSSDHEIKIQEIGVEIKTKISVS